MVQEKIWKTALYLRLSREDEDKGESNSIINQKRMLMAYVEEQPDLLLYDIYVDDGYSGTTFERPSFQRMIADIKKKQVECVAVKDLSRFGRNYIDAGEYLEKLFPRLGIRFIAVNDGIDSVKDPQSMNTILVPFRNLINDEYCRDISNKVRSSLDMKRKQGQYIGAFASYGYDKDPRDHNHLIPDPEAAAVVKDIYYWYLSGNGVSAITKRLNAEGILCPSEYKKRKGLKYNNPRGENGPVGWSESSVRRILSNPMYAGDMVQGVMKTTSYKVQVSKKQPEDQWIIVKNTHEPIVSREMFHDVKDIMKRNKRTVPAESKPYLFSGFLKCGDCGRGMIRKTIRQPYGEYVYYVCSTYTKRDKSACTKHTVRSDWLEEKVLAAIQSQILVAADMDKAREENAHRNDQRTEKLERVVKKAEEEMECIEKMILDLYPDWKAGIITKEEYAGLKQRLFKKKEEAEEKIKEIEIQLEKIKTQEDSQSVFLKRFLQYKNITELTREVVTSLIKMIYVYEDKSIKIQFRYQDPFENRDGP